MSLFGFINWLICFEYQTVRDLALPSTIKIIFFDGMKLLLIRTFLFLDRILMKHDIACTTK